MATVDLRDYCRGISSLIDRGLTDEAIRACQHVFQTFPKHIGTYSLLAKAYLESDQPKLALDIYQRVLAVLPDDLTAHIGMSMIREDESSLDQAIWHMERAYEIQPSHPSIQAALLGLIGKRDGTQPEKLSLTRGALCRLYFRGQLYRQAISEINQLLAEPPARPDLASLLCEAYTAAGMHQEAASACRTLLAQNPYCQTALRLISHAEILSPEQQKEYQQKLEELDPYEHFVRAEYPTAELVPDEQVILDAGPLSGLKGTFPTRDNISKDRHKAAVDELKAHPTLPVTRELLGDTQPCLVAPNLPIEASNLPGLPDWLEETPARSASSHDEPPSENPHLDKPAGLQPVTGSEDDELLDADSHSVHPPVTPPAPEWIPEGSVNLGNGNESLITSGQAEIPGQKSGTTGNVLEPRSYLGGPTTSSPASRRFPEPQAGPATVPDEGEEATESPSARSSASDPITTGWVASLIDDQTGHDSIPTEVQPTPAANLKEASPAAPDDLISSITLPHGGPQPPRATGTVGEEPIPAWLLEFIAEEEAPTPPPSDTASTPEDGPRKQRPTARTKKTPPREG